MVIKAGLSRPPHSHPIDSGCGREVAVACASNPGGLTAYDTQRIKEMYLESDTAEVADKKAALGALALYLDFINLFMMLLQLFGQRRES
jgi:hypothetical protein